MSEVIKSKTTKIGNSVWVLVPKDVVKEKGIKPGIHKKRPSREGALVLLDTSAIIEHFIGSKEGKTVQETVKKEPCYISILTLAEAKKWCLKNGRDYIAWSEAAKKLTTIVNLDEGICGKGADITLEMQQKNRGFDLMDGLILASARSINQKLMTKDRDFEGIKDVVLI